MIAHSRFPRLALALVALLTLLGLGTGLGLSSAAPQSALAGSSSQAPPRANLALLPGDSAIGPAAGNQETPQIVAGGNGYLVVWEDSRTNYAGILDGALPSGGEVGGQSLRD